MPTRRALVASVAALLAPAAHRPPPALARQETTGALDLIWPEEEWRSAEPAELGFDPASLDLVTGRAVAEVPAISVLMAVRDGRIGYEEYFNGHEPDVPINVRSVTKSVTGFLTGIAIGEGKLSGLEQTIGETIPDRIPVGADPNVANVTVGQLLTMSSGIDWPIGGDWPTLTTSPDWVVEVLRRPVTGIPGQTYVYTTGGSHVLGVMVAAAVGEPLEDYADRVLFGPLGIERGTWDRSPQGEVNGGSGLHLTARDQARFGLLSLREGRWRDEQVVPAGFVREATRWHIQGDGTGGWEGYGYQWWITSTWSGLPAWFGLGYGGQHVFVVPALDLVMIAGIARRVDPSELRSPRGLLESIAASVVAPPARS